MNIHPHSGWIFQTVDKVAKPRRAIKRNSIRRIVGQGLALDEIESKITLTEKWLERNVQDTFDAFRLLLGGVNCAKHKRHEAPNSFMNLAETVQCTVS